MQQETGDASDGLSSVRAASPNTLICHSQARWDLGFSRTQQLMSRLASHRRVFFIDAAVADPSGPLLRARAAEGGVVVITPCLPEEQLSRAPVRRAVIRHLLDHLIARAGIDDHIAWYDSPLPLLDSEHLQPRVTVYDCAEEPGRRLGAPPDFGAREAELIARADLIFTAGHSLYETRCHRHPSVLCLPSAVDVGHFGQARSPLPTPLDQRTIAHPRIGFAGVVDDRVDLPMLAALASARPDYQIVLVGPVLKRDPLGLPRLPNIHYLGQKSYEELPAYMAGWDVALVPLVRNDSTRFLGPGRAFEYLAAGRPVVSTDLHDLRPLAKQGLVQVAESPAGLIAAIEGARSGDVSALRGRADRALARCSWESTTRRIAELLTEHLSIHHLGRARTQRRAAI
jgi:glycosyltransferase involved in cell wall biosynthesis